MMVELHNLRDEKTRAIINDDISLAQELDNKVDRLRVQVTDYKANMGKINASDRLVTIEDVYKAISQHTDIPVSKVSVSEKKAIASIAKVLKENIIGQDEAITIISNAIKRSKVGLYPPNRPINVSFLIGQSGVGKTLTAKMLASEVFGDEKYLVRFDMSEYADGTSVNKLIGSSAGYVGYDNGGLLTEAIKNKKHAVLLIDEIEKANPEVYNIFLQIFDEGFLTDNMGNKVDFENTIILLTSNIGTKKAMNANIRGFGDNKDINRKERITKELKKKCRPEFINRVDDIIYYNELTDDDLKKIIVLELSKLEKRMNGINISFSYTDAIVDHLFSLISKEKGFGARPITRCIQTELEVRITDYILSNEDTKEIRVSMENGIVKVN
jgi:ATP-dependent Clp protease ATP-binding subunit ClpC